MDRQLRGRHQRAVRREHLRDAAEAGVDVDVRVTRLSDAEELDRKFRALQPVDARCQIRVEGGLNRPPMERTRGIAELFEKARAIGAARMEISPRPWECRPSMGSEPSAKELMRGMRVC